MLRGPRRDDDCNAMADGWQGKKCCSSLSMPGSTYGQALANTQGVLSEARASCRGSHRRACYSKSCRRALTVYGAKPFSAAFELPFSRAVRRGAASLIFFMVNQVCMCALSQEAPPAHRASNCSDTGGDLQHQSTAPGGAHSGGANNRATFSFRMHTDLMHDSPHIRVFRVSLCTSLRSNETRNTAYQQPSKAMAAACHNVG